MSLFQYFNRVLPQEEEKNEVPHPPAQNVLEAQNLSDLSSDDEAESELKPANLRKRVAQRHHSHPNKDKAEIGHQTRFPRFTRKTK